ncbi:Dihydrofolate reductase [Micromonospora rhizosphaerae]|uniref:Dihydrofolate reductase n=1 Tax=Micromonospora rhizosphaerae TaxID=568872 RepID=A0A1C6T5K7_9ACTN|nr:dihydrofolate reductase family protein [Micromonospora rhizosphaerae]SCL36842.1 Dihydrofolate reductase [Micromonospora rhizosphaerae]
MRKLVYWVHQSVDGFIEGPNGEFDWPAMGPELSAYSFELTGRADAFLYGRRVWELMSWYWPRAESRSQDPHDLAFAPIWRRTPKIVISRTLESAEFDARVIGRDLATEVAALKAQPGGELLLTGGSGAAAALTELGLIDEYQVVVHPVVLGGGKPVFPAKDRLDLRLAETRGFDGRSVLLRYARA